MRDQIRHAATCVMSKIAEGFDRGGNSEFRQFLSTSKGSAGEVRSHLYVALDAEFITEAQFRKLCGLADEIGRMIGGLMRHLSTSDWKGPKYR